MVAAWRLFVVQCGPHLTGVNEETCAKLRTLYISHDCPLGEAFTARVTRPLHVMQPGLWAATLSLRGPATQVTPPLPATQIPQR